MNLDKIGFYTLSNKRAKEVSVTSPLKRCELILTDKCNFKCAYCRGIKNEYQGDLSFENAKKIVRLWSSNKLENIRFSGGEPTLWKHLPELVEFTREQGIKRIALSTNGSADTTLYDHLIDCGVDDFSISLDSCCSSTAKVMSGVDIKFQKVTENIKHLSTRVYTTVGVVLDDRNISELEDIIHFSDSLGVHDIRIIPSAQWNRGLKFNISDEIVNKYPILKYRLRNIYLGRHVRGIDAGDSDTCALVLDDMAVLNDYHFPCIIYMREQGKPIGKIGDKSIREIRMERLQWMIDNPSYYDPICKKNCLDVCVDHNNKVSEECYLNDRSIL